jgi:hypothetical protein
VKATVEIGEITPEAIDLLVTLLIEAAAKKGDGIGKGAAR